MNTQRASLTPAPELVSHKHIPAALEKVADGRQPTKVEQIHALMADGRPRAPSDVAEALGFGTKLASDYMRQYSRPGPNQRYHTVDHEGARNAARYVLGPGENVGARRLLDPDSDSDDAALNARYRKEPHDWPRVDVVLLTSINAMVRMGARA